MSERRDPLDELRAAWRSIEPPDVDSASEAEPTDEITQRSVAWMRSAWSEVGPRRESTLRELQPLVDSRKRGRHLRALEHFVKRTRLSVAAAVLLVSGLALVTARLAGWLGSSSPALVPAERVARDERPVESAPRSQDGLRIASLSNEHLELRSGPVRLILLRPEDASPADAR